ncbi:hypothetical protein LCGC14_1611890 [marine sediment metagenome]|uniref:DUF3008 domain-containing protein n=1 Tax=marine sediment metagenome TaxID=412755 RepID=A0A0F9I810_9ZZZZ
MPAESEPQRRAAGAALAVKRGERPASSLKGAARSMLSMTRSQLEDYARTPSKPQTTRAAAHLDKENKAMRGVNPQPHKKAKKASRRGRGKK